MSRWKIGAVSYLNTKPLVYGLEDYGSDLELQFDLPSRLADRLATGQLDVALIPVIEAISNPTCTVVSDACIACRGPVWSVKLYSRVPAVNIESLALDEGSRTSVALVRIILKQQFSVEPDCTTLPIHQPWRDSKSDAVLVIGDRAMKSLADIDEVAGSSDFCFEWDLGDYWYRWTELPFVFAVWAAAAPVDCQYVDAILSEARNRGIANVEQICQTATIDYGISVAACRNYLTQNLHFRLGQREKMGLNLFFEFAKQQSLIQNDSSLQFHDFQTTG